MKQCLGESKTNLIGAKFGWSVFRRLCILAKRTGLSRGVLVRALITESLDALDNDALVEILKARN